LEAKPVIPLSIVEVAQGGTEIESVLALWRSNRRWLGFLPTQGFTDRIAKGTLIAAVRESTVVGYVLYDLPRDRIKVVHLCVADDQRGAGVARALIDEVSDRHRERQGIELACRRDYPASDAWPHLGFVARQERMGRSDAGLPLTLWFRDHGHPDLFTFIPGSDLDDRLAVALDQNVVIDLVTARAQAQESAHLEDDWLTEHIVLCITDEVDQEIHKCEDATLREQMRSGLHRFRRLSTPVDVEGGWEELVPGIEAAAPQADGADHRHLARAMAGGASTFVTRDRALNEAKERILAATSVQVMRPEELIAHVDRLRSQERYEPTALHATALSIGAAAGSEVEFVRRLLNYAEGERKAHLEGELRRALADPVTYEALEVTDGAGNVIGGVVRTRAGDVVDVQVIRVGGSDRMSYAAARQLAHLQRQEAADTGRTRVVVRDSHLSAPVRYALGLEGYLQSSDSWISEVRRGIHDIVDLDAAADRTGNSVEVVAALERTHWPMKVTGGGLPTYLVPIRPGWAEQLFDSTLAAGTLFGRELSLGLSREHVYYRRPRNSNGIAAPARILWYVSGQSAGQVEGSIRAVSQLAEVVVGRPLTVHQRFARLGVYNSDQVRDTADAGGLVMALRFTDTELFVTPIGLSDIRRISQAQGEAFFAPLSPRRIEEPMFVRLYEEASAYA